MSPISIKKWVLRLFFWSSIWDYNNGHYFVSVSMLCFVSFRFRVVNGGNNVNFRVKKDHYTHVVGVVCVASSPTWAYDGV